MIYFHVDKRYHDVKLLIESVTNKGINPILSHGHMEVFNLD